MPIRDKFLECRVSADILQPPASLFDASVILQKDLRNLGRACNSRRLHLKATCIAVQVAFLAFGIGSLRAKWRSPTVAGPGCGSDRSPVLRKQPHPVYGKDTMHFDRDVTGFLGANRPMASRS